MIKNKKPIGYQITSTWCKDCVPEGVVEFYNPMCEGDDDGVPYECDICGKKLLPYEEE